MKRKCVQPLRGPHPVFDHPLPQAGEGQAQTPKETGSFGFSRKGAGGPSPAGGRGWSETG